MFGQQQQNDDQKDSAVIPDQSIDGVIANQAAPAAPAPTAGWQHPGLPIGDDGTAVATPAPEVVAPSTAWDTSTPVDPDSLPTDLVEIKQQALSQLQPLVSHLDQSPEERFRTTMMMIQASDDQGLVKDAYAAAQSIPDEKARAQALLDIVNEINYFTQQHAE